MCNITEREMQDNFMKDIRKFKKHNDGGLKC